MSKIHVLAGGPEGRYTLVIHTTMPAGNNSVGVLWSDAWVASLPLDDAGVKIFTILPTGTGVGEIANSERSQLVSGALAEFVAVVPLEPGTSATPAQVDALVDKVIADRRAAEQLRLKFYGHTQG